MIRYLLVIRFGGMNGSLNYDETEIESGIIVLGRVTSDLSVFYEMGDYREVTIDLAD